MSGSRVTLPNIITVARIAACPIIFFLAVAPSIGARLWAFALFVAAALSDVWDGYLARRYDLITDAGKLLDPIADKLLLVATFVPFYMVSHRATESELIPWWGAMPAWVLVVVFGRELFITLFRGYAARRGVVIPAGKSGKRKTLFQLLFVGALLLWYPLRAFAESRAWGGGSVELLGPVPRGIRVGHPLAGDRAHGVLHAGLPLVIPRGRRHSKLTAVAAR